MKNDIRLIAIDMDGTLLNSNHEVSEENHQAIQRAKAKGIHVLLSTGRPLLYCREIAELLGPSSYIVTVNGGEIYDEDFNLVDRIPLKHEHVRQMWELKQKHDVRFWSTTVQGLFNHRNPFPGELESYEWLKFGYDIPDNRIRQIIQDELIRNKDLEVTNSSPTNIEINPAGVNKAEALKKVSSWLDLTMDHVMAIGDSLNDLAMIREAGVGVAMGNAQEIVKKHAQWVTSTNEEHGVARAIERVMDEQTKPMRG
ncbi:Cof-type HAD-IIB family hydrolase [Bacillus marinisedimentorum]|uniref:Cof-type HAD-IIB family hydrolase n=1 Tax=Bacillus marinisedimentorum TaxID=1821260 RepID=UPI0009F50BD3|nr:Cof-type HAD-IIB family hydrolase [Bacillus marinisedimentorum]